MTDLILSDEISAHFSRSEFIRHLPVLCYGPKSESCQSVLFWTLHLSFAPFVSIGPVSRRLSDNITMHYRGSALHLTTEEARIVFLMLETFRLQSVNPQSMNQKEATTPSQQWTSKRWLVGEMVTCILLAFCRSVVWIQLHFPGTTASEQHYLWTCISAYPF